MFTFLDALLPDLEEQVADAASAVDLEIADGPVVLPRAGYVLLNLPPSPTWEDIPVPLSTQRQAGGGYLLIMDQDNPATATLPIDAACVDIVREMRARFLVLKGQLFRVFPRLSYSQQAYVARAYHDGFILGGALGDLLREHQEQARPEPPAQTHGVGARAVVHFGSPLPGRSRGR